MGEREVGIRLLTRRLGRGGYIIDGGSNGGVLLGLALGLLQGFAAVILAFTGLGIVAGIAGLLASVIFSLSHNSHEQLDFQGARLIGIFAGIVLAVILGGYVVISFTPLFVLGLFFLLFTVARLLIIENVTSSVRDDILSPFEDDAVRRWA